MEPATLSEDTGRCAPASTAGDGTHHIRFGIGAAAILLVAAALRFWALDLGLPHLEARPDETQTLEHTVRAALGDFRWDWAVYPHAYVYLHWLWGELVLDLQALFGLAPSGNYALVWQREPERLYAIGRALTACAGVGSVALVLFSVRRETGAAAGLAAGALLAVSFLHVRDSHALKPDVAMSFAVTLAVVAAARLARSPTRSNGALAGAAVGLAAACKYNGVIAAIPVCAAAWSAAWRSTGGALHRMLPIPLVIAGLCAAAFFALTSPLVLLNETSVAMLYQVVHVTFPAWFDSAPQGPLPALDSVIGPAPPVWATSLGWIGGYWFHISFSMWHGVGVAQTLFAPLVVAWALVRGSWLPRAAAIFLLAWLAVIGLSPVMLSRYLMPLLPALAIATGCFLPTFVDAVSRLATRGGTPLTPRARGLGVAAITAILAAEPLANAVRFDALAATADTRVLAQRWLELEAPAGSRVAVVGTRFWGWGEPRVPTHLRRVRLARKVVLDPRQVDWVVTHQHELFWSEVPPGFLERNSEHLTLVADFDPQREGGETAIFEQNDAYYIPISGFSGVERPGPHVRIYRVR